MARTPNFSIVLLNDEYLPVSCEFSEEFCLPVASLDDLRFQVITDFGNVADPDSRYVVAMPCEGQTTPQDVFDILFTETAVAIVEVGSDVTGTVSGLAGSLIFTTLSGTFAVGDIVIITGNQTNGATSFLGIQTILAVDGAAKYTDRVVTADVDGNSLYVQKLPTGFMIASSASELDSGEYAWDLAGNTGAQIPEGLDCFRLCIYSIRVTQDGGNPVFHSGTFIGTTNCFKKITDLCYTSKIKYQFNEDAMGFYGSPSVNSVRIPMFFSRPQYPGEETGYQTSDGRWLKLSERVNKEWLLETDWLPDALHEKLRIALSADFIQAWNQNENLALEGIYRSEEYNIEWNEDVDYPAAKANTTVKKRLLKSSLNSNCV